MRRVRRALLLDESAFDDVIAGFADVRPVVELRGFCADCGQDEARE